ncbi:uncharacterized protein [Rutidosis leptorrhynchoides]|uniref:uncharacterized protein n=1 Tax=Rutidosis leptorrhynchoides TaxID=125765 RepID=UPI003A99C060
MTSYVKYLQYGALPADSIEARRIKVNATLYVLDNGVLYRRSFNSPNLRCLGPRQAANVLSEMHEGLCAQHSAYWTIVARIMRQGYYWQTVYRDTTEIIKTCDACQRHGTVQSLLKYDLILVFSAWPFCKWAIDIVGPTIPKRNQFAVNPFKRWCEELSIKQTFTSVAHLQANGQVEVTNEEIVTGIKARLGLSQTKWVSEVPYVSWTHRAMPKWYRSA